MSTEASKPIVRWCIGGYAHDDGYGCLRESIRMLEGHYPGVFDKVVLHNNCDARQRKMLQDLPVRFIDQKHYLDSTEVHPAWKLSPPRLDISTHEIFMDNDVVLHKHFPLIDEFLAGSFCFMTEGLRRRFGQYDQRVAGWYKLNSGFWGLPPGFDFERQMKIEKMIEWSADEKQPGWFDEQGLVALLLSRSKDFRMIPLTDVMVCEEDFMPGQFATHFVGLNKGNTKAWAQYVG